MKRYPVVRTWGAILRILGWVIIAMGTVVLFGALQNFEPGTSDQATSALYFITGFVGFWIAGGTIIFGASVVITGELIKVFLDIEENTRTAAAEVTDPKRNQHLQP